MRLVGLKIPPSAGETNRHAVKAIVVCAPALRDDRMTASSDDATVEQEDEEDEDARLRFILRLAGTCRDGGEGDVHGFASGSRRAVLEFLDKGRDEVLVLKFRERVIDEVKPSKALTDTTNACDPMRDVGGGRQNDSMRGTLELVAGASDGQEPVLFLVRPDSLHDTTSIDLEALSNAMYGFYPHGASLGELHATLRYSFLSAIESSEAAESRSFAKHIREFIDRVSVSPTTLQERNSFGFSVGANGQRALAEVDPETASDDDNFVRQVEAALAEWCEVMSAAKARNEHDPGVKGDSVHEGPLVEIRLWRARNNDLSGLIKQLEDPGMQVVLDVLHRFATKRPDSSDDFTSRVCGVLESFQSLRGELMHLHNVSSDNIKFLSTLEKHFHVLSHGCLRDVLRTIAPTVRALRLVWVISHHYNDDSRMGTLLARLSDALVHRVRGCVCYQELFTKVSGGEDVCEVLRDVTLAQMIMSSWKEEYSKTREEIERSNRDSRWEFDRDRLFSKSDYVAGVSKHLGEMIVVINDFRNFLSPRLKKLTLDADGVNDISARVDALCLSIKMSQVDIFDVSQAESWKSMHKSFIMEKTRIERVLCNFIDACFKRLRSSSDALELVKELKKTMNSQTSESSPTGSTRKMLNNQIIGKMQDVLEQFSREIDSARHTFNTNRRSPPLNRDQPPVSGSVHWARALFFKLRCTMRLFSECVADQQSIRNTPVSQEVNAKFLALAKLMLKYEKQRAKTWNDEIKTTLSSSLTQPILRKDATGELVVNFRPELITLIKETRGLERLGFVIPAEARGVELQSEKYGVYRGILGKMLSRRRDVLDSLSSLETQIFHTRIEALDGASLQRGTRTCNWNSLSVPDFVAAYTKGLDEFAAMLSAMRATDCDIERAVGRISGASFFDITKIIDSDRQITSGDFFARLATQCNVVSSDIRDEYLGIMRLLLKVEEIVHGSSTGKVVHLKEYYARWENAIYEALILATERAIADMEEQFNKSAIYDYAIFKLDICLRAGEIVCDPPLKELSRSIMHAAKSIARSVSVLGRWMDGTCLEVPEQKVASSSDVSLSALLAMEIGDGMNTLARTFNFGNEILENERVHDALMSLSNTTNICVGEIRRHMEIWKRHQAVWKADRQSVIHDHVKDMSALRLQRTFLQYEDTIRAMEEESCISVGSVRVSAKNLADVVKDMSVRWIEEIGAATYNVDVELMNNVYDRLDAIMKIFSTNPVSFKEVKSLLEAIRDVREDTQTEFLASCVIRRFIVRTKHKIEQDPSNQYRAMMMIPTFSKLRERATSVCDEACAQVSECKIELRKMVREFQEGGNDFAKRLRSQGPTSADLLVDIDAGFIIFESFREELLRTESVMDGIRDSERVFGVESAVFESLELARIDLESMAKIYECRRAYQHQLQQIQDVRITDIVTSNVQSSVVNVGRKLLTKLPEALQSHRLLLAVQDEISNIEVDLNLIEDLKFDGFRPRHWINVFRVVGFEDETAEPAQFTMQTLLRMKLHSHAQKIMDITAAAEKELKIENDLNAIDKSWREMRFDLKPYSKGKSKKHSQPTHVLCAVEEISLALEDTGLTLQSMSASRHSDPLIDVVREWEATLALVGNVLQVWTDTQQRWMYLLSIFGGSDDIRMQLPEEADHFDDVDTKFRKLMSETVKTKFILDICKSEGRLELLKDLRAELEVCQKSLSQYLDTKRDAFPRFFFISDEELLSILGAVDPTSIQEHMLKLFDNCANLSFSSDKSSIVGMSSAEGESFKFKSPVKIQGPVEDWMSAVEEEMRATLRALCKYGVARYMTCEREDWIKEQLGMITLVGSQIWWTWEVQSVFKAISAGDKLAMKKYSDKLSSQLHILTKMVRGELSSNERKKVNTLIIIDVHARDIVDSFLRDSILDEADFAWESQLRFKWDKSRDDIVINQCSGEFKYGYEYMGLNGRLVITGLTDRCYITLTTALTYRLGGAPSGPAGTGKTETTKDLAKSMALLCVVFNCGEGLDYKAMGAIFSGLVQCGAWGCFDEFNRIEAEVLSVVSSQIKQIQEALKHNLTRFHFEGKEIKCDSRTGVFITMNPGYAGRTELPDNLKALFRPVTMIVPDLEQICEIMLFSEGFNAAKTLAKKMTMLYRLAKEQLSKRSHYDFGLRALKSVLVMAGGLKRDSPELSEEVVLMRALRDMNLPKFVFDDVPLFLGLINDLFPGISCPRVRYPTLNDVIERDLAERGYQVMTGPGEQVDKIIQLYETMLTRHTTMLVGETGGGKSVILETIARAQTTIGRNTKLHILNPKAQTVSELYGELDPDTRDWTNGLLSNIFRDCNKPLANGRENDLKYIVFDGDVDAVWVENMNSVMDDNRLLTLPNGERIRLQDHCKLLFEVADLKYASPATVSRCGMVYVDPKNLGYKPFLKTWTASVNTRHREPLTCMFEKYMDKMTAFCYEGADLDGSVTALIKTSINRPVISVIKQFCILLGNFLDVIDSQLNDEDVSVAETYSSTLESAFIFCLVWSFGATVVETAGKSDRARFDDFVRRLADVGDTLPREETLYDYGFNIEQNAWYDWKSLTTPLTLQPNTAFSSILVSTAHTARTNWLMDVMCSCNANTLLTGDSGTSKTVVVKNYLQERLKDGKTNTLTINFSSRTTANDVHSSIMDSVEKRTKDTVGPPLGKRLLCFIDDLNMPAVDKYGTQQPIALLKLMLDRGGTYDRGRDLNWLHMKDIQYIAAMGHPGGARSDVDARFVSMFQVFEMQTPDESNLKIIYGSIIENTSKTLDIRRDTRELIVNMTLDLYKSVISKLLPTPSRFHYVFNLRDLSRLFEGMSKATPSTIRNTNELLRLWRNEATRVFHDRLISDEDRSFVHSKISSLIHHSCTDEYESVSANPILFADYAPECTNSDVDEFGNDEMGEISKERVRVYQDVGDYAKVKPWFEELVSVHNGKLKDGSAPTELVLFDHALEHLTRIHRVLRTENGHALLVGVGGSGKQSLARLAAEMAHCEVFEITLTRGYDDETFRDDLKKLYNTLGVQNKATMFLFTDNHVVEEGFLELINNMLTTGIVPALFADEEKDALVNAIREDLHANKVPVTRDEGWRFFISRCRANLHIVLAMSPVGDMLRHRCRNFPGLVNNTVIDWFTEWPKEALLEVSNSLLSAVSLPEEFKEKIDSHIVYTHCAAIALNEKFKSRLDRHNYVTPKHYLDFIASYKTALNEQRTSIDNSIKRLSGGLEKLIQASAEVDVMRTKLNDAQVVVTQQATECDALLERITTRTAEVETKAENASNKEEELIKDSERIAKEKTEAEADLEAAIPALEEAAAALNNLKKDEITEIRSFAKPNIVVQRVCECVMILKGLPNVSWSGAKGMMADTNFLRSLVEFDKDGIKEKQMKAIREYTKDSKFNPEEVTKISTAGAGLLKWVFAMINYNKVARMVNPKRAAVANAEKTLSIKEVELVETKSELKCLQEELKQLSTQFEEKSARQQDLKQSAELMANRLNAAERLISGLASEKIRWTNEMQELSTRKERLIGDCLLTSAFLSYAGPFTFDFRRQFVHNHLQEHLRSLGVPMSEPFKLQALLTDENEINSWFAEGLPGDELSVQNGMLTMRAGRFPLCIDPQMQAVKWIKSREGALLDGKVKRQTDADFLKQLELAIQYGLPFLIENLGEYIDPVLDPVLKKSFYYAPNGAKMIKLGDSEVEWDENFRLYMTTKLPNPHYDPDVTGKTIIINYSVTELGLQEQLLSVTVKQERPDLETEREKLVKETVANRALLKTLEDTLLHELSTAQGEIVDNVELIETLESAKTKSIEISEKLVLAAKSANELNQAQLCYSPVAKRGAILFFVISALSNLNAMYEYSLSSFLDVFCNTLVVTPTCDNLHKRLADLVDRLTYDVYRFACLGLFKRDKLALSFQMTTRIQEGQGRLNVKLLQFFLKGCVTLDDASGTSQPIEWWSERGWQDLIHLSNEVAKRDGGCTALTEITSRIERNACEWREWYDCEKPEATSLPDEFSDKLSELERLCLLRCARLDRVPMAVSNYIVKTMDVRFVTPPISDYNAIFKLSSKLTPVVFILSPGADPAFDIFALGEAMGFKPGGKLKFMALGQGMGPKAEELILTCASRGLWLMLQNCHLLPKWLATLEKVIDGLVNPHKDFRLWLTTDPIATFPIGILQRSLKVVTEPPDGLKMNMKASYGRLSEDVLGSCRNPFFRALAYVLAFFHAAVQERRKYGKLGWNVAYDFNETDFRISFSLIKAYCDKVRGDRNGSRMIPWTALKYLIGEAMYGGRVSDHYDRRVLNAYLEEYFGDFLFDGLQKFMFYDDEENGGVRYELPAKNMTYDEQLCVIDALPDVQTPEVLGLHANADVAHSTRAAKELWSNVLSLQSKLEVAASDCDSDKNNSQDMTLVIACEILKVVTNEEFEFDTAKLQRGFDGETPSPTTVVLFQEIERHNYLKIVIQRSLRELIKALKGEIGSSRELDAVADALSCGYLPDEWKAAAPPTDKDVQSWMTWYKTREKQFKSWALEGEPKVMWLSGLHCPETYIAALIQSACRARGWPLDASAMYTEVTEFISVDDVEEKPELGCLISGLFLEGAVWDLDRRVLTQPSDKCLVSELPILRLVPYRRSSTDLGGASSDANANVNTFKTPVYFTQNRRDAMGRGLVFEADLGSQDHASAWTLRGVALVLNIDA